MRQLNLLIKGCSECPYYRFTEKNDYMYPLCYFRESTPYAVDLRDDKDTDDRCELPEYFDLPLIEGSESGRMLFEKSNIGEVEEDDMQFYSFNGLVNAVNGLPEDWLQGMTTEERENFNREEDERIEQLMREEGFDIPSRQR